MKDLPNTMYLLEFSDGSCQPSEHPKKKGTKFLPEGEGESTVEVVKCTKYIKATNDPLGEALNSGDGTYKP